MKLGEIKVQAILLMYPDLAIKFDEGDEDSINEAIMELKADSNLEGLLEASVGSINRSLGIIEARTRALLKCNERAEGELERVGDMVKIPLEKDFFSLERVVYVKGKVISPCPTELFPSYILVPHYRGAIYNIIYKATLDRITRVTADSYIIPLPENLAEAIPYFVKSELYAQENESEAVRSRQIFDQLIGEFELTKLPCDECLEMIYSMNGDKLW